MKKKFTSMYKGLPLIDAKPNQLLEIEVTKFDVNKSTKNDPANCAAALAYKRMYKTDVEVHLTRTYVKSRDGKAWIRFITPESVSREIISFDRSQNFEPGKYTLRAAPPTERLGVYRGKSTTTKSDKKRSPYHITANVRESARKSK